MTSYKEYYENAQRILRERNNRIRQAMQLDHDDEPEDDEDSDYDDED